MNTRGWYEEARERQLRRKRHSHFVDVVINIAIIIAAMIALMVVLAHAFNRPVRERAAYLEGRWGVDHETAMRHARWERLGGAEASGRSMVAEVAR